ncbi:MAG: histidine kinase [Gemmatimonadota bacterium]|nr:histidine kinase [Gemmatimonadota bacterium]MDH5758971.1 histidine kinase [Gemmatimonadota bacterium]
MKSSFDFSERYGSRAGGYRDLMSHQVRHVLLVSSLYESFILAEDGHLHERVLGKFLEAGSVEPPDLTRVSSGEETLALLDRGQRRVDLIITSPHVGDMDAVELAGHVSDAGHDVPVAVLAYDQRELRTFLERREQTGIVAAFLYQGDARILMTIVQAVEDRLNVARDTAIGVPVFLVVEDNVRFYSSFLPVIYTEMLHLSQVVQAEAGNRLQRIMRARARPKILLATTYERAMSDFTAYRKDIMGVFSDMEFPRDGISSPRAGQDLVEAVRELEPEVPIALQSSNPDNSSVADSLEAGFLLKDSRDFLGQLRRYLVEHLFFGDFVFRGTDGEEVDRAPDLKTLVEKLHTVPAETVAFHSLRHDFSRWLRARGEFRLAGQLRPRRLEDYTSVEVLRDTLIEDIDHYRRERTRGSVNPFRHELFDGEEGIVQIGGGSLGGKGRGLAFASRLLDEFRLSDRFPGVRIRVPPAVVMGTSVFDEFLDTHDLRSFALQNEDDTETLRRMLEAPLPETLVRDLHRVVEVMDGPLAVRSSSLLEDSPQQPLAGIYGTILLPNNAPDPAERLRQVLLAIKRVYASTFSRGARAFLDATPYRLEEEAMAVVIQRLAGTRHGDRFYPHIAGVARSRNYYPTAPARPEDGIVAVALGLGKTVAEGDLCVRFVPRHPRHIVDHSSVEAMLESSQREFWALRMGDAVPESEWTEDGPLARFSLQDAEDDGTLFRVASTYSAENHAIYDGFRPHGVPLVSFAPILKHHVFPLAEIVSEVLQLGVSGTRHPVEIEFAANFPPGRHDPAEFSFLQLRPLSLSHDAGDGLPDEIDAASLICESPATLGHGRVDHLVDWIVVDRNRFDRSRSEECARAVAELNARLRREGRTYGLIGVGRWGSTHPWLGIPVKWEDISGARVIVEAGFRDFRVTPSQGSHFYQNLVSLNIGYYTVNAGIGEGFVDWSWLAEAHEEDAIGCVRHLRFDSPAVAVMNGRERRGVIFKPGA